MPNDTSNSAQPPKKPRKKGSSKWVHPSMLGTRRLEELEAQGLVRRDAKGRVTAIYMKEPEETL